MFNIRKGLFMNSKALKILEYNKIINNLSEQTSSEPGKALCQSLAPMTDAVEIKKALTETSDAVSRIFRGGSISFRGLTDIRASLKSLDIGSTLGIKELMNISAVLSIAGTAVRYDRK